MFNIMKNADLFSWVPAPFYNPTSSNGFRFLFCHIFINTYQHHLVGENCHTVVSTFVYLAANDGTHLLVCLRITSVPLEKRLFRFYTLKLDFSLFTIELKYSLYTLDPSYLSCICKYRFPLMG